MKILYKNKSVKQQFASEYRAKWKYPQQVAIKLMALENAIISADSLKDIVTYTPYKFHPLHGDRNGQWSIYLGHTGFRVTLIPCDFDEKTITTGDIIAQCTSIKVVMVTEVSNHYE